MVRTAGDHLLPVKPFFFGVGESRGTARQHVSDFNDGIECVTYFLISLSELILLTKYGVGTYRFAVNVKRDCLSRVQLYVWQWVLPTPQVVVFSDIVVS